MWTAIRSLNGFAVTGAVLLYYLLAIPWFAPFAFGPAWREAIGLAHLPEVNSASAYGVPLVGTFSATVAMAMLVRLIGIERVAQGVRLGVTLALCFSVAAVAIDAVAPHQPRPLAYFLIVGGYHLVGLTAASAIVTRFSRRRAA